MADGEGILASGELGTAITGLHGTLVPGQAILLGIRYGVTVGPVGRGNDPTVSTCTKVPPPGHNLST